MKHTLAMSWLAAALLCASGASIVACSGSAPAPHDAAHDSAIARVHRARCGNCHQRVDPERRTRPELEVALKRHRKRVHLSEGDWAALLDYLAPPERVSAAAAARQAQ